MLRGKTGENAQRLARMALEKFSRALATNIMDTQILRECGDAAFLSGDHKAAESFYKRSVKADPNDGASAFKYAVFLGDAKQYKKANEYFLKAVQLSPDDDHLLQRYGHYLEARGDHKGAERYFVLASTVRKQRCSSIRKSDV